jgi:hypothetical protein
VVGSSGSGPGTINVTGSDAFLYFSSQQTVTNTTINLGNSSSGELDTLGENFTVVSGNQVLTLASSVTTDVIGNAQIYLGIFSGVELLNQGVIDQTAGNLTVFRSALARISQTVGCIEATNQRN